jgi:c-di-GMP-binding flagellar brake protein YcgR
MTNLTASINTEETNGVLNCAEVDIFDDSSLITPYSNRRKSVRYVRKDVTAFISQADMFGGYSLFSSSRAIRVKLLDISSRGTMIGGPSKLVLKINQKIMLTLIFTSNKKFEIPSRIKREFVEERTFYGVKFDEVHDDLGEYLLESQADLVFK